MCNKGILIFKTKNVSVLSYVDLQLEVLLQYRNGLPVKAIGEQINDNEKK